MIQAGPWEGSLELLLDYDHERTRDQGVTERFESTLLQEILTIRNPAVHVRDPRLLTLSLEGSFGLSQEWVTGAEGGGLTFSDGTLWGYDLAADFLRDEPLALRLFATRSRSLVPLGRPGRSQLDVETRGATLEARWLPIPSRLTVRQELVEEESKGVDFTARREEERTYVTYEGRRGWIDSDLELRYEFVDLVDRVYPRLDYRSHEGYAAYGIDFGPDRTWHGDVRARGYRRDGGDYQGVSGIDLTTALFDAGLRIDHTPTFQTSYRYLLTYTDSVGGAETVHSGAVALRHQLWESLRTTAAVDGSLQRLDGGDRDRVGGRVDLAYTKRLPGDGRLTAGLGGSLEYEDDRFRSPVTFVPQETQTVSSPFALPVRLRNPFVVEASVVVTRVATGPLPVGCFPAPGPPTPLVAGRDYTLRTVGSRTEIVPLPCAGTTPGLNPGDTIAVDYRFEVSPALSFVTAAFRADVSVDYGWIRVFALHDRSDEHLVSGRDDRFLDDQETSAVGLELRHDAPGLTASLLGEARRYDATRLAYDSLRATQLLSVGLARDVTLTVTGEQSVEEYRSEDRTSHRVAGRALVAWVLASDLLAEAGAGYQWLEDSLFPTEETWEARVRVRWRVRKLEINPAVELFDRQRGDTDTREYRVTLQVIRRF
jgi:hypothetical protein